MKKNAMIDIETMGTSNNAAIISIGVVLFDKEGIGKTFYAKTNLESCLKSELSVDASTIIWWMQQSEEARKEFYDNEKCKDIELTLFDLSCGLKDIKDLKVWGNGSNFDITILENAFKRFGIPIPWKYYNIRCFRTYKAMSPLIKNLPKDRTSHNAVEDAIWQAEYAIEIMNKRFQ